MRFKFETNYNMPYYQRINAKFCVVSISSVIKKGHWFYPQIKFQDCFYEISN